MEYARGTFPDRLTDKEVHKMKDDWDRNLSDAGFIKMPFHQNNSTFDDLASPDEIGGASVGSIFIYVFYGITLMVMLFVLLMCFTMALNLIRNCWTIWKHNNSVSFSEDSLIVSQLLLTVLQSACLIIAITWKIWPKIMDDPDCCELGYCRPVQNNTSTEKSSAIYHFPRYLHEMSLEASLAAVFLVPVVYPLSALFPSKCGLFYMAYTQSKLICIASIWFPWFWIGILFALPDLANWTLLFLSPLLTLHTLPMIILLFNFHLDHPTPKAHFIFRIICPKEGPLNTDSWHYRRWMCSLVHYTWTVIGYLPAVILALLLPNCPHPIVAIIGMMIPCILYTIIASFTCVLLFCTRLVHHCTLCSKDETLRMPHLTGQCNWCREHKGLLYRKLYQWPTPFGRHLQRCMLYRYAVDSEGGQVQFDDISIQNNRTALLSGV